MLSSVKSVSFLAEKKIEIKKLFKKFTYLSINLNINIFFIHYKYIINVLFFI